MPTTKRKIPQDRQPKAEARVGPVEFDYDGEHYTIDRDNADNIELMEYVEGEKYLSAIRGYLGAEQWDHWKDTHRDNKGRVASVHFEPFMQAVMDAIGGSGNSLASPSS